MSRFLLTIFLLATFNVSSHAAEFIWGITGAHTSASSLYAINPTTGAVLGQVGSTGANALAGLSMHPATRVLYAANGAAAPTGLFTINKTTGAATLIGSSGKVVPCMSFDSSGVLYAWSQVEKKLMTLNLSTGAGTVLNGDVNASGTGLEFGPSGILYLKSNNALYTLNKATGMKVTGPLPLIPGGAVSLDNLLVFNPAGTLFSGVRIPAASSVGTTSIYAIDPVTGAANLVINVPLALTGFVFDSAGAPTFSVKGKKKITTKKATVTIKGTASSLLPLTVSAPKAKPAQVLNGEWALKVKLKRGKNAVRLSCADGLGQPVLAKVTVLRN